MSTVAELEQRIANLRRVKDDLFNELAETRSEIFQLNRALRAAETAGNTDRVRELEARLAPLRARRDAIFDEDAALDEQIAQLNAQITAQERAAAAPRETSSSAAQVVQDDQAASGEPTTPQVITPEGRIETAPETVTPTNAQPPVTQSVPADTGTDAPIRPLTDTQSTSGPSNQGTPRATQPAAPAAPTTGGTGSGNEDAAVEINETRAVVGSRFTETIKPQPNVLDRYYSYTYVAELRMVKPEDYGRAIRNRSFNFNTSGLLIRSGGAKTGSFNSFEQKRNQYFDLDFYLDNITIKSLAVGSPGSAHSYTDIAFTVTEPNGISFIDRLYMAIKDYIGIENYAAAIYIMTIKFYAYDENGNIVIANNQSRDNLGDPRAIVTKIVPFRISEIGFRIDNNLVTYQVTGTAAPYEAVSTDRGTVTRNIEISGGSVQEVLGRAPQSSAPPKASATAPPTSKAITSLMEALNEEERKLVANKIFDFADQYSIEFAEPIIASAQVNKKGLPDLTKTPMSNNANTRTITPERQASDKTKRIQGISAGTPIVQAIETVIRNSSFVTDQADIVYDETTDQPIPISQNNRAFSWFKINVQATPLQYDSKRNDYAMDIRYIVSLYEIKGMDSPYFPKGRFSGVHKSYPYWFTGKNTAVLDYQQTYNYAYSVSVTGSAALQQQQSTSNLQQIRKYTFAPRSAQNSAGGEGRANEVNASAAAYLYDQSALGKVTMKIIGDPAWLAQGELFPGVDARNFPYTPFLPDGTINFDSGQVLFEINWVKGQDYDINTGLVKLDPQRLGRDNPNLQSLVYQATDVTSEFRSGSFTQQLEGNLYIFAIPNTVRENSNTVDPTQSTTNNTQTRTPAPSTNAARVPPPSAASDPTTDTTPNPLYQLDDGTQQLDTLSEPSRQDPIPQSPSLAPTSSGDIRPESGLAAPPVAGSYGRFTTLDDTNDQLTVTRNDLGTGLDASLAAASNLQDRANREAALRGGLSIVNYDPQLMNKET